MLLFWKHFLYVAFEMLLWISFSMEIYILGWLPVFPLLSPHCALTPPTIPNQCSYFSSSTAPQTSESLHFSLCIFCLYFSCSAWAVLWRLWGLVGSTELCQMCVSGPFCLPKLSLTPVVAMSCPSWIILKTWSLRSLKLNAFSFPILIGW